MHPRIVFIMMGLKLKLRLITIIEERLGNCSKCGSYIGLLRKWKVSKLGRANTTSAKLAEKLGYEFDKAYDTYFVDNR